MEILKGSAVAKAITEKVRERIADLTGRKPRLAIVRVGEEPGDLSYEAGAKKRMEKAGVETEVHVFPRNVDNAEFLAAFEKINGDPAVDGILVFRPLPAQIDEKALQEMIDIEKDVDCISPRSMEKVFEGNYVNAPCTPQAVLEMLDHAGVSLSGKRVTVIGRSMVVGRPLAMMLLQRNATVTICHSRTADLPSVCREADILVAAVGRARMITDVYVKEGAVVIDVGINTDEEGNLTGDVDFDSTAQKAALLTPVPGGVGAVTTSVLLKHVTESYFRRNAE